MIYLESENRILAYPLYPYPVRVDKTDFSLSGNHELCVTRSEDTQRVWNFSSTLYVHNMYHEVFLLCSTGFDFGDIAQVKIEFFAL